MNPPRMQLQHCDTALLRALKIGLSEAKNNTDQYKILCAVDRLLLERERIIRTYSHDHSFIL